MTTIIAQDNITILQDSSAAQTKTITSTSVQGPPALLLDGSKTMVGEVKLASGTADIAPIKFQAGPLLTTIEEGAVEYFDGHFYFTNPGARHVPIMANGVVVTNTEVTNTTTETVIYSKTFGVEELHVDEAIILTAIAGYSNQAASDDFIIRFKIAGNTIHTITRTGGNVAEVGLEMIFGITIRTAGVSGTYVHYGKLIDNNQVYTASHEHEDTIDTTITNTIEITMQWDNAKAGNTLTATQGYVQLLH